METDIGKDISLIDIPLLVLESTHGSTSSQIIFSDEYKQLQKKSIIISPARHFIMYDDPAWFLEQVKNFLLNGFSN